MKKRIVLRQAPDSGQLRQAMKLAHRACVLELGRITETPTPHIEAIYAVTALLTRTLAAQHGRLAIQGA